MFLNETEIKALTNRTRSKAQQRQLNTMGIQYRVRADGSLVVLSAHVDKLLGGNVESSKRVREPKWEALKYA